MAATLTRSNELTYFSFPIEKVEQDADGSVVVWGKATDDSVDSDQQIVDPEFAARGIAEWMATGPNIRVQHQAQRDPAGVGIDVSRDGNAHWVKSRVIEPVAKQLVLGGALRAYSVGIAAPTIQRDAMARGGRITDGQIVEISLVDRPANKNCGIQLVKAASDGTPEWVEKIMGGDALLTKAEATEDVTVTLPADVHVAFSPSDMARIMNRKSPVPDLVKDVTTVHHGGVPGGSMGKGGVGTEGEADGEKEPAEKDVTTVHHGGVPGGSMPKAEDDDDMAEKRDFDPNVGGGVDRDRLPDADFAGRNRSFPIVTQADVSDALQSIGRAGKDNYSHEKLRRNILRIARRKGFAVPEADRKKKTSKGDMKAAASAAASLGKKMKVACMSCGAKQNSAHGFCSECGKAMVGAPPVKKNHDYLCLGCGKDLDKGERFCPGCGKENPGFNAMADLKIPANKSLLVKGKKKVKIVRDDDENAEKAGGKKDGKKPFGGHQAPPFGKDKDKDDDDKASKTMDAPVTRPKTQKAKSKGRFGDTAVPTRGVTGMHAESVPAHREPDGWQVASIEHDMGLPTDPVGDAREDAQIRTIMRLKSVGIEHDLGYVHDLVCPAYTWNDVQKSYPAGLSALSPDQWQAKALQAAASAPLHEAKAVSQLGQAAFTIKSASLEDLIDVKTDINKAFRDANPGPGTFPTPGEISARRYNRPYITAGHAAPSMEQDAPNKAPVPPSGDMAASHYERGYLHDGRAADSPANKAAMRAPYPQVTGVPSNLDYSNIHKQNLLQAFSAMHSHFDRVFPGVCPMNQAADSPAHPLDQPQAHKAAAPAVTKKVSRDGMTRKQRRRMRKKLTSQVMKGKMPLDEARIKMGKKPCKAPEPLAPAKGAALSRKDVSKAVSAALSKSEKKHGRQIARLTSMVNQLADQPDPGTQAFKGMAMEHPLRKSARPAGVQEVSENAARTQAMIIRELENEARNSTDPARREAAWAAVVKAKGLTDLIS